MAISQEQIKEAFNLFDADGSQAIDIEEFGLAMKGLGFKLSHGELEEMMAAIDKDNNSLIEYDEFNRMVSEKMVTRDSEAEVMKAFKLFDIDNTGFVTVQNMVEVTKMLGENTPDDVMRDFVKEADLDGDGKLSFEEWQNVMTTMKGK
ncbi:Caltractin [Diplonema papillatum]|nr:Caltractin [Diplonema papillatum]